MKFTIRNHVLPNRMVVDHGSKSVTLLQKFWRQRHVTEDIAAGDVFTSRNLRIVRTNHGLPPKYYRIPLEGACAKP